MKFAFIVGYICQFKGQENFSSYCKTYHSILFDPGWGFKSLQCCETGLNVRRPAVRSCHGHNNTQPDMDPFRRDICHKHHKQRLCKIISTRVKFHFVNVLLEQFMCGSFWFLVMRTNDKVISEPASTNIWSCSNLKIRNAKLSIQKD